MRAVVTQLDLPADQKFVDDDEAFQHECGHGGRVAGEFVFTYITPDGKNRWEIELRESQIRDIADGLLIEVDGVRDDMVRTIKRQPRGLPLVVWGEYRSDALQSADLTPALDALHASGPRMLRLWSTSDDQLVAIVRGDDCAIYVLESYQGYGTSYGSTTRTDSFELHDHDGRPIVVPFADCVPWSLARAALVQFADGGALGLPLEGRIPSGFLMLGDADRAATLAQRGSAPETLAESSLAHLAARS